MFPGEGAGVVQLLGVVDELIGLVVPDDPPGLLEWVQQLITVRNATEYQLSVAAAQMDRLGVAKASGSTTSKLLQANGVAPGVAARWLRIGAGLSGMDRTAGHFRDGFLSTEHVDAVVKGRAQVIARSEAEMTDDDRVEVERKLWSQAIAGATPREIEKLARSLGNQVAKDSGGTPPAEEPLLNRFDFVVREGRVVGEFDLDSVIGEKLHSAISLWSKPRPEPDGSRDRRSPTQLRADAFHRLLDCGGGSVGAGAGVVSVPRTEVIVTVPADHPDQASLRWVGPITEATAQAVACDSAVTLATLDGDKVPVELSSPHRLFTGRVRKAIFIRDSVCIKCGQPADWSDCHHIEHWQHGGKTTLHNGCLLCKTCHQAVHNTAWDVIMGADGHPWLIPPADIDPHRRPLPAYNRRTLTLAA
jgi:hypothetical protein